ncbi:sarcosine oxidase [Amycolatopsis bartoniae]|uniref:FAD dependent oxidoreductase domain-containing protein n=1 Tax=Amycolatopsis bartoniae TaxID=941986 RepID=A0A8H9M525_9PSEU|nr:FAD-dependent oxidoreductase [Amycolatopsis bartoniae]MBB2937187.1 sarcosine oxidase [Amycolatopsis bartoniae]GHF53095.1 hypothetical protein GCM10017566_28100 [Amycolatopsis bartoniae]
MSGREADVVVVGAGGTGSAAAWQLAARGVDVLVLEARPADEPCRAAEVFRVAGAELSHNHLALQALPLWRELEQETSTRVLTLTGGVAHGHTEDLDLLAWAADAVGKPGRWLPPEEAVERWPGLRYAGRVFFHPLAGRIDAGVGVPALRAAAVRQGAVVRRGEPVTGIEPRGDDLVEVRTTERGYRARRVVVAAGASSANLAGGFAPRANAERTVDFAAVRADLDWPVFFHHLDRPELAAGGYPGAVCGMAEPGAGLSVGFLAPGAGDPAARQRALRRYAHEWLPGADPDTAATGECRYAASEFVVARRGPVVVGSGFAGQGFQFLPAVGRALAELATTGDVARYTG